MKKWLILLTLICTSTLFAAKPEKVSITYTYESNDKSESFETVTEHAFERAKQRVLEEKFGVDVSSIVVYSEQEREQNGSFSSSEDFFSLGGTNALGEIGTLALSRTSQFCPRKFGLKI